MTSNLPLITVITPAYNVESFISPAIESVIGQSEGRFEYIVVSDGSTDQTVAKAKEAADGDDRVRVIDAPHGGSSAARNVGLREAKGEYVSFLDGDDVWHTEKLARQLELIQSLPDRVGAVFCGSRIVNEAGKPIWVQRARKGAYDFDDLVAWYSPPGNGSSLLIKRTCFEDTRYFDENLRSSVDMDLWYEMAFTSQRPLFYGSRELLVDYRRRAGTITSNTDRHITNLDGLLAKYSMRMRRLPRGAAYVKPAIYGIAKGTENTAEIVDGWVELALSAGRDYLLRDSFGIQLMAITAGGKATIGAYKSSRSAAFTAVNKAIGLVRR